MAKAIRNRLLSGMRPTGELHIGHFEAVLNNWKRLQDTYESYFFVADWHALTTDPDSSHIKQHTVEMVKDWLAYGIDPKESTIFVQSQVPEHAELSLLLERLVNLGTLRRLPTFKGYLQTLEAQAKNKDESKEVRLKRIASLYDTEDISRLRDNIAYDESIESFEVLQEEDYKYLGSFEISMERGFPPQRHFKEGKQLPKEITEEVAMLRKVLSNREKVKFALFQDYDHLRQLTYQLADMTGLGEELFYLDRNDLETAIQEPVLADYRIGIRKIIRQRELFGDPIFEKDLKRGKNISYEKKPQLIFGLLPDNYQVSVGTTGHIVESVNQTVDIPNRTKVVFVPDNVRPGSHLFTILSDYSLPVVSIPKDELRKLKGNLELMTKDGYIEVKTI